MQSLPTQDQLDYLISNGIDAKRLPMAATPQPAAAPRKRHGQTGQSSAKARKKTGGFWRLILAVILFAFFLVLIVLTRKQGVTP